MSYLPASAAAVSTLGFFAGNAVGVASSATLATTVGAGFLGGVIAWPAAAFLQLYIAMANRDPKDFFKYECIFSVPAAVLGAALFSSIPVTSSLSSSFLGAILFYSLGQVCSIFPRGLNGPILEINVLERQFSFG